SWWRCASRRADMRLSNALKESWTVVAAGRPVVRATRDQANAVPAGVDWLRGLTAGAGPNHLTFAFRTRRPDGNLASSVRMRLFWTYGAQYRGGGAFIPNAWLDVLDCLVAPDAEVDVQVRTDAPLNRRS